MNTETTDKLVNKGLELMNWLEGAVKTAADFGSEQIPLFIQELLKYNFIVSLSWFIFGLVLSSGAAGVIYYLFFSSFYNEEWDCHTNSKIPKVALLMSMGVLFLGFGVGNVFTHLDWVKIKYAPRVYLMDYAKDLIKENHNSNK